MRQRACSGLVAGGGAFVHVSDRLVFKMIVVHDVLHGKCIHVFVLVSGAVGS